MATRKTVTLSVKKVPIGLVERLREQARRHHRSLQGELMSVLERAVEPRGLTVEELMQRVKALGLRTSDEATQMIRETRDER